MFEPLVAVRVSVWLNGGVGFSKGNARAAKKIASM